MNAVVKYIIAALLYIFFQLYVLNHLVLFQMLTPFAFLLFLFMLPLDTPKAVLYILAFGMGLFIDIFSNNYATGLHAFSALFTIGLRPRMLQLLGASGMRGVDEFEFENQSVVWYITYLMPLIFCHHLAYHFLEAFTFSNFWHTLNKVFLGTIYTFLVCYLLCIIFYKK